MIRTPFLAVALAAALGTAAAAETAVTESRAALDALLGHGVPTVQQQATAALDDSRLAGLFATAEADADGTSIDGARVFRPINR